MSFDDFDVIYTYTRKLAIDDGCLISVNEMAKEAGIKYDTAVTAGLWGIIVPNDRLSQMGQSTEGRLWDVLQVFRHNARRCDGDLLFFDVLFLNEEGGHDTVRVKAVVGPNDDLSPCITLLLGNED